MQFLCPSGDLGEGRSRAFTHAAEQLFGIRRQGRVYLYRNRCPHRGIRLNWDGSNDAFLDDSASLIHCAHHGALFVVESGECVAGPCEGEHLDALECLEDSQGIWLIDRAAPAKADR
ncbi:Rieske (2Fe-2S) protein [Pseudomonas capeferrum]|uniref:Rieske (2Fe-2S) protein n=1 Tax=Pseudomonas capeferrum TaxID=1495066 RepID=UPI0015E4774D|nr:Rieske (2Fe-2S) protein [Pseudomonas capeferrum]MBA1204920.1 Rieske (2Fe-2S) protein [Pseudomonas capeferrum]